MRGITRENERAGEREGEGEGEGENERENAAKPVVVLHNPINTQIDTAYPETCLPKLTR